ncbi:ATP-binding cassette domain-containing protein [Niveispirillum sp. BGYR6]|uniref:methionine ABC transporter ATP-binding protein n=1 Tax=Niveispirillum sp. BGYR6 TaxID=2971249 RepID=UPI0022B95D43|nr:ATP-binding cassette domain-containing protein [Niveispirillum sp. BGYR6]MDG5493888.1 ATP-binding cassette domain-containing protein [Niveispirillum sp. BGYR6]
MVRLTGLRKVFGGKGKPAVTALDGVDLIAPTGSITAIIGPSGAGKSSLLRAVNLLERPDSGSVIVGGQDLTALSEADLRQARQSIGMIFQHFNLLANRTVAGNVALALELAGWPRDRIGPRVAELLELVGLTDKAGQYPAALSGGQKQRVGIARALAPNPQLLLCDEATSALDPETTRQILELLRRINRQLGLTVLLITHEMSVVREVADHVVVLEAGRIIEQGDVTRIFTHPQHPTTRDFLAGETGTRLPAALAARLSPIARHGDVALVRLHALGPVAAGPVLAGFALAGVAASLVAGRVQALKEIPFAALVLALKGDATAIAAEINHLRAQGADIEELGHVAADAVAFN